MTCSKKVTRHDLETFQRPQWPSPTNVHSHISRGRQLSDQRRPDQDHSAFPELHFKSSPSLVLECGGGLVRDQLCNGLASSLMIGNVCLLHFNHIHHQRLNFAQFDLHIALSKGQ